VIESGVSGILVDAGDRPALASAIGALAADPSRARALGLAAREDVRRRFSLDRMLASYRRLYESLLAGLPAGRQRW
jgi:glycosyltransferase involved in cell wall biosynthesis